MNYRGFQEIFAFDAPNLKTLNDTLRALWKREPDRSETITVETAARYEGPAEISIDPAATDEQLGTGASYRSLREALSALNGRRVDADIVINLQDGSSEYGEFLLAGMSGTGSVSIYSDPDMSAKLMGSLKLYAVPFQINLFGVQIQTESEGIYATACPMVDIARCRIDGPGIDQSNTRGVRCGRGANIVIRQAEIYNCERSLFAEYGGIISAFACKGNCRVGVNWSTMYLASTMPCDSAEWTTENYAGQIIEQDIMVDQGLSPSVPEQPITANFAYSKSDSYRGGWGWFADNDIRQGWDGKPIYGVIWFDAAAIQAAIGTKTVQQASIRLHMRTGVGRGVAVDVQLYGSDVSADKTTAPQLTTSYGTIGKTNPGELNEISIPVQAVEDLVSEKIGALVLKSDDDRTYGSAKYSRNYARFGGSTSADESNCPMLTVVYQ